MGRSGLLWCLLLAVAACGDSSQSTIATSWDTGNPTAPVTTAPGSTSTGETSEAASTGTSAAPTTGGTTGTSEGPTTDWPFTSSSSDPTASTGFMDWGCKKVDFLFVVDNSQTMEDEQSALAAAFPQFLATIQSTLTTADDYHIMVVDTDAETRCTAQECASQNPHETCDAYACTLDQFQLCDSVLGAGVVHPAGVYASNELCKPYGSPRYLTHDDPMIESRFACMARVGTAGAANERPMDAIVAALGFDLNGQGGCNEGFLRDDAILVVTFFSDDPNLEDTNTPAAAHAAVMAAKGDDATKVNVLGLIPMAPDCVPAMKPDAGAHWLSFIELFGARGKAEPICAADFNQFFADSIAIIEESCALQPPE